MDNKKLIKELEILKYALVLDQEYKLAANLREVIKFLKIKEDK